VIDLLPNASLCCRPTREGALNHEETSFAWQVSSSSWFAPVFLDIPFRFTNNQLNGIVLGP
jgi:hypothetical protein